MTGKESCLEPFSRMPLPGGTLQHLSVGLGVLLLPHGQVVLSGRGGQGKRHCRLHCGRGAACHQCGTKHIVRNNKIADLAVALLSFIVTFRFLKPGASKASADVTTPFSSRYYPDARMTRHEWRDFLGHLRESSPRLTMALNVGFNSTTETWSR